MKLEGRDIKGTKRSESKHISWTKKFIRKKGPIVSCPVYAIDNIRGQKYSSRRLINFFGYIETSLGTVCEQISNLLL